MLKITIHPNTPGTTLQIEGAIAGPWVDELRHLLQNIDPPIDLDLTGVDFMDQHAVLLIEASVQQGVDIIASSNFATLMLRPQSPEKTPCP